MIFKFPFETLLKQRKRMEEAAQREFVAAQVKVNEILNIIDQMYSRVDEVRIQISEIQKNGNENLNQIQQIESFIDGQKVRIEMKRAEARELMQVLEEKQEILIEKTKEHKALKILKEKQFKEFQKMKKKKEAKNIEDLVTMRFRRSY